MCELSLQCSHTVKTNTDNWKCSYKTTDWISETREYWKYSQQTRLCTNTHSSRQKLVNVLPDFTLTVRNVIQLTLMQSGITHCTRLCSSHGRITDLRRIKTTNDTHTSANVNQIVEQCKTVCTILEDETTQICHSWPTTSVNLTQFYKLHPVTSYHNHSTIRYTNDDEEWNKQHVQSNYTQQGLRNHLSRAVIIHII